MQIIIFEDEVVDDLAPVTTGRPAYAVSCASYRLIDWLATMDAPISAIVRPHLLDLQKFDYAMTGPKTIGLSGGPVLLVNARLVPCDDSVAMLGTLLAEKRSTVVQHASGPAAILLQEPAAITSVLGKTDRDSVLDQLAVTAAALPAIEAQPELFCRPHDIVAQNMKRIGASLEHRLRHGEYREVQDGVFLGEGAKIGQYAVIDTSQGPIVLDRDVKVGPFCFLAGPVYAGPNTKVIEHAALKDAVSLGHTVKIGGEVEASVIEPYSNKQHHGFLGHSYLGSWINLGAGTCNSDLKNTYGPINMQYDTGRAATNMQFMGCIMGDYTKSAINTGIFTGKVIGVCSMLYGFVTSNVPSFVNYARLFGQTAELPPEVMIATQQRMFSRRKVAQRECDQQLIRDMHRLTEHERENHLGVL